ncbi:MAG: hypothetical protein JWN14_4243 [Chthonomonadales bacterium]|nr:hypothetical protein [Chthonomonadales bacterium]
MRFPSEPNETGRTEVVQTALHEAARYESDTAAPKDLVARALARHGRSGSRCGRSRPAPALLASACGLILLMGIGFWLHGTHFQSESPHLPGSASAVRTKLDSVAPVSMAGVSIDLGPALLPPIETAKFLVSNGRSLHRVRGVRHGRRPRLHSSLAQNSALPLPPNRSAGVWTTETVEREVVMQTLTPVWVAHADPETATITVTPALFQLALQPDDDADPTATQIGATLIPVRFEQENTHP